MKGFRECPRHKEPLREAVWKRLIICRGTNWSQMVWIIQYKQAWRETIFPKKHRKANCMFPVLSCSTFCAALLHGTCRIPLGFSLTSELLQSAQQLGFHFKFSKLHSKHVNICIFLYTYAWLQFLQALWAGAGCDKQHSPTEVAGELGPKPGAQKTTNLRHKSAEPCWDPTSAQTPGPPHSCLWGPNALCPCAVVQTASSQCHWVEFPRRKPSAARQHTSRPQPVAQVPAEAKGNSSPSVVICLLGTFTLQTLCVPTVSADIHWKSSACADSDLSFNKLQVRFSKGAVPIEASSKNLSGVKWSEK